jgi:hypothetical protein
MNMRTEPLAITAAIRVLLIGVLLRFGVELTEAEALSAQVVIEALIYFYTRQRVTSEATLDRTLTPVAAAVVKDAKD